MAPRTALPALAAALGLLVAAPAQAAQPVRPPAPHGHAQKRSAPGPLLTGGAHAALSSKLLWATVNTCDTFESPDAMGLRASMPGNGTDQRMYMRFSAQWYSGSREAWLDVPSGRSPWVYAGSARYAARQAGWSFNFETPSVGTAYVLRGIVDFQWRSARTEKGVKRSGYRIARERSVITRTGMKHVRGGDPKGTSKAMCAIANLGTID